MPLQRLDAFLEQRSRNVVLLLSLVAAIAVGVLDYFTAPDLLLLYLGPIFVASWYGGWRRGMPVAVYCAASAFVTPVIASFNPQFSTAEIASLLVRLAGYLLIARAISRLRESRRQQQELAGFIVHDLRSPLASSITGLQTLQQTGQGLGEVEKEMVELALVGNQRALGLVNSILDVAKLESGKMEVAPETVELEPFVDACLRQVELWARGHGIALARDLHVERATLDPQLTGRVLVNLLSNALKFSPEGGTVTVRVTHGRDGVRFAIADQGPGIPPEYADAIFEPFSQVKGTQGGTGLGLTFCLLAVQAQHGRIWVESHVGRGTTMHFTIPQPHGRHSHEPTPRPAEGA